MSKRSQKRPIARRGPSASSTEVPADLQKAIALHQRGQLVEAEAMYRNILKVAADHFDATHLLGVVLLQRHQLVEGEQLVARALKINPHDPSALTNRGNALKELKRFEEALASYEKVIALKPDYAEAINNRGIALKELKRFDEALASYDKAIASRTDSVDAFYRRGVAEVELGDFAAAVPDLERAVTADADYDFHRAKGLLAHAYAQTGQAEKAESLFRQATKISTSCETYYNYATFLQSQGRAAEAREWAQKILDQRRTMPGYQQRRERVWFRKAYTLLARMRLQ